MNLDLVTASGSRLNEQDFTALHPLREAAKIIAAKSDWPQLYDVAALQETSIPVASASYYSVGCACGDSCGDSSLVAPLACAALACARVQRTADAPSEYCLMGV